MTERSDSELVDKARAGDMDAFGDLVRRHHARVAGLCANLLADRADADDAAQEIFIKAYRALDRFQGDALFTTWLYRITTNHCIDMRKLSGRRKTTSLDAIIEDTGESAEGLMKEPTPHEGLSEETEKAEKLLAGLPDIYKDALVLRTDGLSYEEIAAALECTLDAVKARLRRARRLLAESMGHAEPAFDVKRSGKVGEIYGA